eukprot:COSAG01_NODE_65072_length_274_cov_0.880000_1_plen_23_part_01
MRFQLLAHDPELRPVMSARLMLP